MGPLMIRSFSSREGITRNGSYVKNRNFIFEMVLRSADSFGRVLDRRQGGLRRRRRRQQGGWLLFLGISIFMAVLLTKEERSQKEAIFIRASEGSFAT